ncbi:MAG TPA: hypothetical protein VNS81_12100 [Nocardioides sp.]|nr:hypothetical protein [Nocardioides sp.]
MGLDMRGCTPVRLSVVMVVVAILATWTAWSAARDGAEGLTGPVSAAVSPPLDAAAPEPAPRAAAADDLRVVRRGPVEPAAAYAGEVAAIPAPAFAAYQRAASVIDATVDCGLDWTVVAAIGRVESDHGRGADGTHRVTPRGRVEPDLVGAPLDGTGGRGRLADSDGGALDGDATWDAPVGPMGILPATWSAVAVDADNDGIRAPQDLDDAALATAVLLCAGGTDLGVPTALRTALASYDRAPGFATTVLAVADRYTRSAPGSAVVTLGAAPALPVLPALPPRGTTRARPEAPVLAAAAAGHHAAVRKHSVRASVRASDGPPPAPVAVPSERPTADPVTPADPTACPVSDADDPARPTDDSTDDPAQQPAPDPASEPADDPACAPDPAEDPAAQEPATDPTTATGQPSGEPSTEPVPDSAP